MEANEGYCPKCGGSGSLDIKVNMGIEWTEKVGCDMCNGTGIVKREEKRTEKIEEVKNEEYENEYDEYVMDWGDE